VKHWWEIGWLLPALMLAAFLGNIALCFMPEDFLSFRTWEPALSVLGSDSPGPFEPNLFLVKRKAYGDLASLGNFPGLREEHDEEFRSDKFGYRNSYAADTARSAGIVVGDSFVSASSVPADKTLSGQLTTLDGGYYYNAGGFPPPGPDAIESLLPKLNIPSGTVVFVLLERRARSAPPSLDSTSSTLPPLKLGPFVVRGRALRVWSRLFGDPSPAAILSRKIFRRIQNDVLQPNIYKEEVVRRTLQNNDEMLFYPADIDPVSDVQTPSIEWSSYLKTFANRMAKHSLRTIVLLVPNKYTVYGPVLKNAPVQAIGERLMTAIQNELSNAGVPVVNVTSVYLSDAENGLSQKHYLYWRDDTHWNANGIGVAANQMLPCIQALRKPVAVGGGRPCGR